MRFKIIREPDDPLVSARASVGGGPGIGYYLVFRGDPDKVLLALRAVLDEAERALPAGRYNDTRGRPQG